METGRKTGLMAVRALLGASVTMAELRDFWGGLTPEEKTAFGAQAEADSRVNPAADAAA